MAESQDVIAGADVRLAEADRHPVTALVPDRAYPLKRSLDVTLAVLGILLSAPIWLLVAVAIKLHRDGTILYRQERWGQHGSTFTLYKFRTMVAHSDATNGITQAGENDGRVTLVGRLLRRTGIDELPQLVNILKGDMSLVGPRALAVGETVLDANGERVLYENSSVFLRRLRLRPGLTGPATIYLPKDAPPTEKFEQDLAYAKNQSFKLDLKLIVLSLWISLRGKWETRGSKL